MIAPVFVRGNYRITGLYVAPEAQAMGVGTSLMKVVLSKLGNVDIYIGVASHVKRLQGFYESFDFQVLDSGRTKQTLPDPVAYIQMMRPGSID